MDNKSIRHTNLRLLIKQCSPQTVAELAKNCGLAAPYLYQITAKGKHRRDMGDQLARQLELGMGKPRGWMDETHTDEKTAESSAEAAKCTKIIELFEAISPEQQKAMVALLDSITIATK